MMALGEYRFSIGTSAYDLLERNNAWRWPSVNRVGARPALQFTGRGETTISLSGTIYPHFRGGLGQVEEMEAEANKGEPLLLVDGRGLVWGKYCITSVRDTREVFFSNGVPRLITFDMQLSYYG